MLPSLTYLRAYAPKRTPAVSVETELSQFTDYFVRIWVDTSCAFPDFEKQFPADIQEMYGREVETVSQRLARAFDGQSVGADHVIERMPELRAEGLRLVQRLLVWFGLSDEIRYLDSYCDCLSDFVSQARNIDPTLSFVDLYQASRNVLIINSIQTLIGRNVSVTDSALAYSLMYPYTDNYLDDLRVDAGTKAAFLSEVKRLLIGLHATIRDHRLEKIRALVGLIENSYPRKLFPNLWASLIAIHRAQASSVGHQRYSMGAGLSASIQSSFEKGGASVVADAYIAAGTPDEETRRFAFGYGAGLQLIDDLQDLEEDADHWHSTLFTDAGDGEQLERLTNRLFNFVEGHFTSSYSTSSVERRRLAELSLMSCRLLILDAVSAASGQYSADYLRRLERVSPLSMGYLRSARDRLKKNIPGFESHLGRRFESVNGRKSPQLSAVRAFA